MLKFDYDIGQGWLQRRKYNMPFNGFRAQTICSISFQIPDTKSKQASGLLIYYYTLEVIATGMELELVWGELGAGMGERTMKRFGIEEIED